MNKILKHITRELILGIIGAVIYMIIEIAWDGSTDWSMGLFAGVSFMIGGLLNEFYNFKMKIWLQSIIITIVILLLEYFGGKYFVNVDYSIWDYRNMTMFGIPSNLDGQICVQFALIWFVVFSPLIIWMDDYIRHKMFKDSKPNSLLWHYKALFTNK